MISIIIPVYNAQNYIQKCIKSVLDNIYTNFEIIVVDDGSNDDSLKLIKLFNDKRIKIFKQSNKGPGAARNLGLQKAMGDYVFFLDSDDTIDSDTLDKLINCADGYDVVIGNYRIVYASHVDEFVTPKDCRFNSFFESVTIWNRLYSLEFLRKNNILFYEIYQGEDRIFLADIYIHSPRINIINCFIYNWIRHENDENKTLTHLNDNTLFDGQVDCMIEFKNILESQLDNKNISLLYDHLRYCCCYLMDILKKCNKEECNLEKFYTFINSLRFNEDKKLFKEIFNKEWSEKYE